MKVRPHNFQQMASAGGRSDDGRQVNGNRSRGPTPEVFGASVDQAPTRPPSPYAPRAWQGDNFLVIEPAGLEFVEGQSGLVDDASRRAVSRGRSQNPRPQDGFELQRLAGGRILPNGNEIGVARTQDEMAGSSRGSSSRGSFVPFHPSMSRIGANGDLGGGTNGQGPVNGDGHDDAPQTSYHRA